MNTLAPQSAKLGDRPIALNESRPAAYETGRAQTLLIELGSGDRNAFWHLWEMYSTCLYRICFREMNRNRAEAEEALAEAMMRAQNKLPIFA